MTALLQRRSRSKAAPTAEPVNRVVLHGIDWRAYCTMADALPERRIRFTYDNGDLEIMTVSTTHERYKGLIPFVVFAIADELNRTFACFGSFTHRREDLLRAIEPDCCFYVANFETIKGRVDIDLERDPPPDLVVEVEISRSLLDRLSILQALGVPEVWRVTEQAIKVLALGAQGYREVTQSPSFPEIPIAEVHKLLGVGFAHGEQALVNEVRAWCRKHKKKRKSK
jgi:Uma2 family endonuclease